MRPHVAKKRLRFIVRTISLFAVVGAALVLFFTPVARINTATCTRIEAGMTLDQAESIVGAPQGWHDGIKGFQSTAPHDRKGGPWWVGFGGDLEVYPDNSGQITKANLYPITILHWSLADCLWERFTRIKYLNLTLPTRILVFFIVVGLLTIVLGVAAIDLDVKNGTALHGVLGLAIGIVVAVAVFSEGFFWETWVTFFAFLSPILGAMIGIFVGGARYVLVRLGERSGLLSNCT